MYELLLLLSSVFIHSLSSYKLVDVVVPGCPAYNASDFTNVTDLGQIPLCYCDKSSTSLLNNSTKKDDVSVRVTCFYTSTMDDLSKSLQKCKDSKKHVEEIYLLNMVFDTNGIPDDYFFNLTVTPSVLHIENCLGNDKRLIMGNFTLRGLEKSLTTVEIISCTLNSLPPTIADMKSLKSLTLIETVIYIMHKQDFQHLHDLRRMELGNNYMYYFEPGSFDTLENLETLILGPNNGFNSSILEELNKLKNLKSLEVTMNSFHSLPNNAFHGLKNLYSLNLSMNFLETLHADVFKGLTNLHILDLSLNSINVTEYNAFHGDLKNLRELYLYSNYLTDIEPETFINLNNLEILDLSWNDIQYLPANSFEQLTKLKSLNLSGNINLFYTEDETFTGLSSSLESLNLSQTYINNTDSIQYASLGNLITLDLGHTPLQSFDGSLLKMSRKLKNLYLNDTKLTTLNSGLYEPMKNLKTLDLSGTRLICNKNLAWLMSWIQFQNQSNSDGNGTDFINSNYTTCWVPLELRGTPLSGVNIDTMQPYSQITLGPWNSSDENTWPTDDSGAPIMTQSTTAIIDLRNSFIDKAEKLSHPSNNNNSADKAKIIIIVIVVVGILITAVVVTIVVLVMKRKRRKEQQLKENTNNHEIELRPRRSDTPSQQQQTTAGTINEQHNHANGKVNEHDEEKYEDVNL